MKKDNQNQDSKLQVYELALLIDPKLSEDKAVAKSTELGDLVAQGSGAVLSNGQPRMRNLAYEMTLKNEGKRRDFTKAYFNWIKFEQDPELINDIDTKVAADESIVRHLVIKTTREDTVTVLTDEIEYIEEDVEEIEGETEEVSESTDEKSADKPYSEE